MTEQEERNWLMCCHLGGIIPVFFLDFLVPNGIWLLQRNKSTFIDEQGKEIVNFRISYIIYGTLLLLFFMAGIGKSLIGAGAIFFFMLNLFCCIKGAFCAYRGEFFTYPLNLNLLK